VPSGLSLYRLKKARQTPFHDTIGNWQFLQCEALFAFCAAKQRLLIAFGKGYRCCPGRFYNILSLFLFTIFAPCREIIRKRRKK